MSFVTLSRVTSLPFRFLKIGSSLFGGEHVLSKILRYLSRILLGQFDLFPALSGRVLVHLPALFLVDMMLKVSQSALDTSAPSSFLVPSFKETSLQCTVFGSILFCVSPKYSLPRMQYPCPALWHHTHPPRPHSGRIELLSSCKSVI